MQTVYLYTYTDPETGEHAAQYCAVLPPSAQDYELAHSIGRVLTVTEETARTRKPLELCA